MSDQRYRCSACGNLTRFDVLARYRTRAFHHFTVGGDFVVEEEEVLDHDVEEVVCRWCGHGRGVEVIEVFDDGGTAAPTEPGNGARAVPSDEGADASGPGHR